MERIRYGRTGLMVSRLALGGYPFAGINRAQGWDPYAEDGMREARRTIHAALDGGVNYIDTAMAYGAGHSETIIGSVMETRRDACYLATKVSYNQSKDAVIACCEESLKRLKTDHIDVYQFHGGWFTAQEVDHILNGGPMDAMLSLKQRGLIRFIGFTTEEAWTGLPLVRSGAFDTVQVCYNISRQAAGHHLLNEAKQMDMGVSCMRPMTSGILQRQLEYLAPGLISEADLYRLCMSFLLSDSRVHLLPVGMRWEHEVKSNIEFVEGFRPACDVADLPRMTATVYEHDDARNAKK